MSNTTASTHSHMNTPDLQPSTRRLLKAIAGLAAYAQARPTDSDGIRIWRKKRAAAEKEWFGAGCPNIEFTARDLKPQPQPQPQHPRADAWKRRQGASKSNYVMLAVVVRAVTKKALLVSDGTPEAEPSWLPRQFCRDPQNVGAQVNPDRGDTVEIAVPRWLAEKEGLV